MSKGEKIIGEILSKKGISYQLEYIYDRLLSNGMNRVPLRFDFAVLDEDLNVLCLIEFDGVQHFKPITHWGGKIDFRKRKLYDSKKNKFCLDNGILLFRIPYWDIDKLSYETLFSKEYIVKEVNHYNI